MCFSHFGGSKNHRRILVLSLSLIVEIGKVSSRRFRDLKMVERSILGCSIFNWGSVRWALFDNKSIIPLSILKRLLISSGSVIGPKKCSSKTNCRMQLNSIIMGCLFLQIQITYLYVPSSRRFRMTAGSYAFRGPSRSILTTSIILSVCSNSRMIPQSVLIGWVRIKSNFDSGYFLRNS